MKLKGKSNNIKQLSSSVITKMTKGARLGEGLLNGILGDHLYNTSNGLCREMHFYMNEMPLELTSENIKQLYPKATKKLCILVHGLINDETIWNFANSVGMNYGSLLQKELKYTPFYVRYNTGIHISQNGKLLSQLIQNLLRVYPVEVEDIIIIAHSMGGLVSRSAAYYAPLQSADWIYKVNKMFFLGTPHLGAPLEKFGNAVTFILKKIPVSYSKLTGDIINLRSAGIKDLRYGYLTDEDWQDHHPDELLKNNKTIVPLLEHVTYFLITGTLTDDSDDLINQWFGDALVRKNSATGLDNSKHHLAFNLKHHREFTGLVHHKLVNTQEVYDQIKLWVSHKSKNNNLLPAKITHFINKDDLQYFPVGLGTKKTKLNGASALAKDAIREGITKLDELNKSRVAYKILNHIPLLSIFSKEIENVHVGITEKILGKAKSIVEVLK